MEIMCQHGAVVSNANRIVGAYKATKYPKYHNNILFCNCGLCRIAHDQDESSSYEYEDMHV